MQRESLEITLREEAGRGASRRLRASGTVPAVVYGTGVSSTKISVNDHRLEEVLHHGANILLDLTGPDALSGKLVLIKDCQRDSVSQRLLHCDFYAVDLEKPILVGIPIRLEGRPHGVEMGGVLEPLIRDLEVSCLPLAIPDSINVDVSELDIGGSVHVRDLVLPEDVDPQVDPSDTVVHVIAPRVEEEETPEEEEALAEGEAPPAEDGEAAAGEGEAPAAAKSDSD